MGQLLRLALYLWYALPAFSIGFSVRPPPATCPTIARHVLGTACARPKHLSPSNAWTRDGEKPLPACLPPAPTLRSMTLGAASKIRKSFSHQQCSNFEMLLCDRKREPNTQAHQLGYRYVAAKGSCAQQTHTLEPR